MFSPAEIDVFATFTNGEVVLLDNTPLKAIPELLAESKPDKQDSPESEECRLFGPHDSLPVMLPRLLIELPTLSSVPWSSSLLQLRIDKRCFSFCASQELKELGPA
jgi:hypothetical protein